MDTEKRKEQMRHDILLTVKANNLPTTGELFFRLAFASEATLVGICRELHIAVEKVTS